MKTSEVSCIRLVYAVAPPGKEHKSLSLRDLQNKRRGVFTEKSKTASE